MQWEKPESVEISLGCEIGSYANAELPTSPAEQIKTNCPRAYHLSHKGEKLTEPKKP